MLVIPWLPTGINYISLPQFILVNIHVNRFSDPLVTHRFSDPLVTHVLITFCYLSLYMLIYMLIDLVTPWLSTD